MKHLEDTWIYASKYERNNYTEEIKALKALYIIIAAIYTLNILLIGIGLFRFAKDLV